MINGGIGLILGGAGYIGSRLVRQLILKQASCIIVDNKKDKVEELCKNLKCMGPTKIDFYICDISDYLQLKGAFKHVESKFKKLDFVINCAAIMDEKQRDQMIDTNLVAATQTINFGFVYLEKLKQEKRGLVLTVTSNLAMKPIRTLATYSGISNYLVGYTQAIGNEKNLKKYSTKVCTVCLGLTETPFYQCNKNLFSEYLACYPVQEVDDAVCEIMKILEHPKNGAVYEVEDGKSHLLTFPDRKDLKV